MHPPTVDIDIEKEAATGNDLGSVAQIPAHLRTHTDEEGGYNHAGEKIPPESPRSSTAAIGDPNHSVNHHASPVSMDVDALATLEAVVADPERHEALFSNEAQRSSSLPTIISESRREAVAAHAMNHVDSRVSPEDPYDGLGSPHSTTYQDREPGEPAPLGSSGISNLVKRLRKHYGQSVLKIREGGIDVSLATFQRVQLETIQRRLLEAVLEFKYLDMSGDLPAEVDPKTAEIESKIYRSQEIMNEYVTAWKNFEFMKETRKNAQGGGFDPFAVRTEWFMRRESLRDTRQHVKHRETASPPHKVQLGPEFSEFEDAMSPLESQEAPGLKDRQKPVLMGGTRSMRIKDEELVAYMERLGMALIGGVFLIAPMLIMVLHPGLVTSLVTTSVFVFAFSMVMSLPFFLKAPFDVLSATAAYAAVLVVFIGVGGGPSQS